MATTTGLWRRNGSARNGQNRNRHGSWSHSPPSGRVAQRSRNACKPPIAETMEQLQAQRERSPVQEPPPQRSRGFDLEP